MCCGPWAWKESDTTERLNDDRRLLMEEGTVLEA